MARADGIANKRRTTKMCFDCIYGRHTDCETEGCPCVCNEPMTVKQRKDRGLDKLLARTNAV